MAFTFLDFSPGVKVKSDSLSQLAAEQTLKVLFNFCKAFTCNARKRARGYLKVRNCKYLL